LQPWFQGCDVNIRDSIMSKFCSKVEKKLNSLINALCDIGIDFRAVGLSQSLVLFSDRWIGMIEA